MNSKSATSLPNDKVPMQVPMQIPMQVPMQVPLQVPMQVPIQANNMNCTARIHNQVFII